MPAPRSPSQGQAITALLLQLQAQKIALLTTERDAAQAEVAKLTADIKERDQQEFHS